MIITDFQIFNHSVLPGDSTGILDRSISVTKEIDLNYRQNVFSFEFTAISFINAQKNRYAYKMEGFNNTWIYTDASKRIATFTNLSPGTYVFRVKASNNDGTWNERGTSVTIRIHPPFYMTWWFILLCAVTAVLIVYGIYAYRMSQLRYVQKVRNNLASDLHDDIGSGLSSISIYSEIARSRKENQDLEPLLEHIDQTSRSMSDAIHDIVWTMNPDNDSLEHMVKRMHSFAAEILGIKGIDLHFHCDEQIVDLKLGPAQRKNVFLLYKEAVNNIAKYAEAKNVRIEFTKEYGKIKLSISDDGKGFNLSESRDGNGLNNMKKRTDEMNGTLSITSEAGKGTRIVLEFRPA